MIVKDIYDDMPPEIGVNQRRYNKERLAALDAETLERQARMAIVIQAFSAQD